MKELSNEELIELGEQFGIAVGDREASSLQKCVTAIVNDLGDIDDVPVWSSDDEFGERSWHPPDEDPHNAISVRCHVPPRDDHSELLADATVGIKDIIAIAHVPMDCASEVMQGFIPGTDATVIKRLRAAGATITAKTNLDEFAGAPHGITAYDGPITNPYDKERLAGGSSSGSGVAVALDEVDVALGTDTGGSIRIPAAFCGVVGLKPTYGLVPLAGIVENTYTQDHVGPMTRTVRDAARALEAVAGKDESDPASLQAAGRDDYRVGGYDEAVNNPPTLSELTVGVLEEGFGGGVEAGVAQQVNDTVEHLEDAGAEIRTVSAKYFAYGKIIKNCLSFAEMAAHWRAGGAAYRRGGIIDEGIQVEFARRATASSQTLSEFYKSKLLAGAILISEFDGRHYTRAQAAREMLQSEFERIFTTVDAIVLPTMPDVAPRVEDAFDPGFDYGRNVRAANVTRLPAITIPSGFVNELPVGLQLMAPAFHDAELLGIASSIESHLDVE